MQGSTQSDSTGIGMQLEEIIEIRKGQDWGRGVQNLQHIKRPPDIHLSTESIFFMSSIISGALIINGASDFRITLNKASIVVCES